MTNKQSTKMHRKEAFKKYATTAAAAGHPKQQHNKLTSCSSLQVARSRAALSAVNLVARRCSQAMGRSHKASDMLQSCVSVWMSNKMEALRASFQRERRTL
jgi:hypothetical protein